MAIPALNRGLDTCADGGVGWNPSTAKEGRSGLRDADRLRPVTPHAGGLPATFVPAAAANRGSVVGAIDAKLLQIDVRHLVQAQILVNAAEASAPCCQLTTRAEAGTGMLAERWRHRNIDVVSRQQVELRFWRGGTKRMAA